ncbi:MAG: TIM barrel protein, partial [Bacilli bacterium]
MLDHNKVKVGIAPIGWSNDDLVELGGNISFEQCINEMAQAKYQGCEVGNKYPKDPEVLKSYLQPLNLEIASAWFSSFLTTKPYEETELAFIEHCRFLKAMGAHVVVVSEQGFSIQGQQQTPIFKNQPILTIPQQALLFDGLNQLGQKAQDMGLDLVYHHHMGTCIQSASDIDLLMASTNPKLVYLLFDSGHLAYCNQPYLDVLSKYIIRIKHVHLKDIRPAIVARVKEDDLSF